MKYINNSTEKKLVRIKGRGTIKSEHRWVRVNEVVDVILYNDMTQGLSVCKDEPKSEPIEAETVQVGETVVETKVKKPKKKWR